MKRVVCLLLVLTLLMEAFPVSAYGEETSQLTAQNSDITARCNKSSESTADSTV